MAFSGCELPAATGTVSAPTSICIGGWYLPSMAELQLLVSNPNLNPPSCTTAPCNNVAVINTAIGAVTGGIPLVIDATPYWSSNSIAFSGGDGGYTVELSAGGAVDTPKDSERYARAYRQF